MGCNIYDSLLPEQLDIIHPMMLEDLSLGQLEARLKSLEDFKDDFAPLAMYIKEGKPVRIVLDSSSPSSSPTRKRGRSHSAESVRLHSRKRRRRISHSSSSFPSRDRSRSADSRSPSSSRLPKRSRSNSSTFFDFSQPKNVEPLPPPPSRPLEQGSQRVQQELIGNMPDSSEGRRLTWMNTLNRMNIEEVISCVEKLFDESGGHDIFLNVDAEDPGPFVEVVAGAAFGNKFASKIDDIEGIKHDALKQYEEIIAFYIRYLRKRRCKNLACDCEHCQKYNKFTNRIHQLLKRTNHLENFRLAIVGLHAVSQNGYKQFFRENEVLMPMLPPDEPIGPKFQILIHCFSEALSENLMHNDKFLMRPVRIRNAPIRAYKNDGLVHDWLYGLQANLVGIGCQIMSKDGKSMQTFCDFLLKNQCFMFPKYDPDQNWICFKNGMLKLDTVEFFCHDDPSIPFGVIACSYHDIDLDWEYLKDFRSDWDEAKWLEIETPLRKVYELQFPSGAPPLFFFCNC